MPLDSLRSAHYTAANGLSASILDELPLNYAARRRFPERRETLSDIAGAVRLPRRRVALRRRGGERRSVVPFFCGNSRENSRSIPGPGPPDLGDDPLRAADAGLANLAVVPRHVSEWIDDEDVDFILPFGLPESVSFYCNALFGSVIARLGGVRINERYAGDAGRSFEPLPAGTQREAMRWLLSRLDDLQWLDSRSLIVGGAQSRNRGFHPYGDFRPDSGKPGPHCALRFVDRQGRLTRARRRWTTSRPIFGTMRTRRTNSSSSRCNCDS